MNELNESILYSHHKFMQCSNFNCAHDLRDRARCESRVGISSRLSFFYEDEGGQWKISSSVFSFSFAGEVDR